MKKLPIGISTLSSILDGDCIYVDKTALIAQLVNDGRYYFLSRPRRFGKSLLVDTLKELFEGNEALFRGLHIHPHWDWMQEHPVIHISFNDGVYTDRAQLEQRITGQLQDNAAHLQIELPESNDNALLFARLLERAVAHHGQPAVVLIDEYDKPMNDQIDHPERAIELRDGLKNLYSVLKGRDTLLRFVLLTGVSKFSQVSLFSGLNNLQDITLRSTYSSLCGYTQVELEQNFADYLPGVNLEQMRRWYNGYNWLGESVYNPFDVLLFLQEKLYRSHWFATATPTFLLKLLKAGQYYLPELEHFEVHEASLGSIDIGNMSAEALLFQTGYLTIHNTLIRGEQLYLVLGYPNQEVKVAFTTHLLAELTPRTVRPERYSLRIYDALAAANLDALHDLLKRFFASIPHDWYRNNHIDQYEGYYASLFYAHMVACGANTIPEDVTSTGQIDLTVIVENKVFIVEFKALDTEQANSKALAQIKSRHYADKYHDGRELYLVGIEFSKPLRNIVGFEWERVSP
ncbi:ATP-binding protein [Thiothrix lacustris]|uniref:ATP-binding protein n=1 Tax=Thiothrix lacustris TaxID=525917 RepID=UPI0027E4C291|nr:AAA family ATPase [Thiothrix lacustris]WMP18036.1 AAA family ATPase [Thiothrix lacustris]